MDAMEAAGYLEGCSPQHGSSRPQTRSMTAMQLRSGRDMEKRALSPGTRHVKRRRKGDPSPPPAVADRCLFSLLPDEMLEKILSYLPPSEQMNLKLVSRRCRAIVTSRLPHHMDLRQFKSTRACRDAIEHILPKIPWLRGLRGLSLRDVQAVATHCKQLRVIEVNERHRQPLTAMKRLATGFPFLQEVTLSQPATRDADVEVLLENQPGLRRLVLDGTRVTGSCFRKLPRSLQTLSVSECRWLLPASQLQFPAGLQVKEVITRDVATRRRFLRTDADLASLVAGCPRLARLVLNYTDVTGAGFHQLQPLEQLSLAFCCQLQSASLRQLRPEQLRELDLRALWQLEDEDVGGLLTGCRRLTRLKLTQTELTEESLQHLPRSLESLRLHGGDFFQAGSLLQIAKCKQLRFLSLGMDAPLELGSHFKAILTGCPLLEGLEVYPLDVPLEECLPTAGLPHLRRLDVLCCHCITDSTLAILPCRLPQLQVLNLTTSSTCKDITERGLLDLHRLRQLRGLEVAGRPVTEAFLDGLYETELSRLSFSMFDPAACSADCVVRLVLGCPSLKELALDGDAELVVSVVERLRCRLPAKRALTLGVEIEVIGKLDHLLDRSVRFDEWLRGDRSMYRVPFGLVIFRQMVDGWFAED